MLLTEKSFENSAKSCNHVSNVKICNVKIRLDFRFKVGKNRRLALT